MIRLAAAADAPRIAEIYRPYVLYTSITFEYTPPFPEEMACRIGDTLRYFPYLVWEQDGVVLGYAYAHLFRERAAYQWNAELSVYVDQESRQGGIGGKLYRCLMEILKRQGFQSVYACITSPNPASVAFHHKLGFEDVGNFPHCGFKNGKWYGVEWLVKHLVELTEEVPAPTVPVSDLPKEELAEIMRKFD